MDIVATPRPRPRHETGNKRKIFGGDDRTKINHWCFHCSCEYFYLTLLPKFSSVRNKFCCFVNIKQKLSDIL